MIEEKTIRTEYRKLRKLYSSLPDNRLKLVTPMIQNAAFMKVTLDDLQTQISEEGCTEEYQNGATQSGKKASSSLSAYIQTMKQYTIVIKQLDAMLPEKPVKSKLGAFMDE